MQWLPIEQLPKAYKDSRRMLVVRATVERGSSGTYTTDPYCVWIEKYAIGYGPCGRWPHPFFPTHFCELPE